MSKQERRRPVKLLLTSEPNHCLPVAGHLLPGPRPENPGYWKDTLKDPCVYCGRKGMPYVRKGSRPKSPKGLQMTKEHLIPASHGGSNGFSNVVRACADCNQRRGTTPILQFLLALRAGVSVG